MKSTPSSDAERIRSLSEPEAFGELAKIKERMRVGGAGANDCPRLLDLFSRHPSVAVSGEAAQLVLAVLLGPPEPGTP